MRVLLTILLALVSIPLPLKSSTQSSTAELTLSVVEVSRTGSIKVDIANSSTAPVRIWDEDNSWGAAHWRVFLVRNGKVETFFENPRRKFTRNLPNSSELAVGGHVQRTLNINEGNWCGFNLCSSFDERGFGGRTVSFDIGDTLIVSYDVPLTYEPEIRKLNVWSGVAAIIHSVK